MSGTCLLGVDIGTLGSKGVITDLGGQVLAEAFQEHDVIHPCPGWAEHDPERDWWDDFVKISQGLLAQSRVRASDIAAINVSGLVPNMAPTDADGVPLRNAILYSDNRAVEEIRHINDLMGTALTSENITPKILWFRRHEPQLFARTAMLFNAHSYVIFRLTGRYTVDHLTAHAFGGIYSRAQGGWLDDVAERLGIPIRILPPSYGPAEVVGYVTKQAARATGLAEGTPVLAGTGDTYFSLLGAGLIGAGDAMVYYGTAGLVIALTSDLEDTISGTVPDVELATVPAAYLLTSGELVRWFRDQLGGREAQIGSRLGVSCYQLLDRQAEAIPPGSEGLVVLPYFQGQRSPVFNPLARGVFFGLTMSHTRNHLYRALLESFGYGCRHGLEEGLPNWRSVVRRLVATGGGARSETWRQIVSDVLGMRQEYAACADAPLGGAFFAGYGVGLFESFQVIRDQWLQSTAITDPIPANQEVYDRLFPIYRDLHQALEGQFTALDQAIR